MKKLLIGFGLSLSIFLIGIIAAISLSSVAENYELKATILKKQILIDSSGNKLYEYMSSDYTKYGDEYIFTYETVDGYSYLGTTNNEIYMNDNTFVVNSNVVLVSYFVEKGYKCAFLVDAGYKLLDEQVGVSNDFDNLDFDLSQVKVPIGYTKTSNYSIVKQNNSLKVYMAEYQLSSDNTYNVTVSNGTASSNKVKYDNRVTVESNLPDFTCWKVNDEIVSYNKKYTFSVYNDVVIVASNEDVPKTPVINVKSLGSSYYVASFDLGDYKLVETGMIFGGTTFSKASKRIVAKAITSNNEYAVYNTTSTYNAYLTYMDDNYNYYTIMANDEVDDLYDSTSIYVSTNGSSLGNGSLSSPYNLKTAISKVKAGGTIYVLSGTYVLTETLNLSTSGSAGMYKSIYAYNDVVLDFSALNDVSGAYNKTSCAGFYITGNYWHIKGFEVSQAGSSGIRIAGNNNIVEDCELISSGNSGIQISGSSSKTIENWPSHNTILNCTSSGSYDWNRSSSIGEDADGFACKLTSGYGNSFDGCIANNNSDDGWDLFTKRATGPIGAVTIVNCIAFNNGYGLDDEELMNGNGFKMGGRAVEVNHIIKNSIAFNNKTNGFDDNSNPGCIRVENCTSYNNGRKSGKNFAMGRFTNETNTYTSTWTENGVSYGPIEGIAKSHNIFKNVLSYTTNETSDQYCGTASYSYFGRANAGGYYTFDSLTDCNYSISSNRGTSKTVSTSPFVSTTLTYTNTTSIHEELRNQDGTVFLGKYLEITGDFASGGENGYSLGANLHNEKTTSKQRINNYNNTLVNIPTITYDYNCYSYINKTIKNYNNLKTNENMIL